MQQQRAIVHSEEINRKGEIKYFQIPLLGTAIKIIGVEASAFLFTQAAQPTPTPAPNGGTPPPPAPAANNCPNPGSASIESVSSTVDSTKNEQVFRIGAAVNPGFIYSCGVYSVVISVTAVDGDTPATIAAKLATEVNNTSLATWSQYGSNNRNFKPSAQISGDLLTLFTDPQHSFFASGTGSCTGAPPPPPPSTLLQYDPLFTIAQNEKAGILSLQSPDITDIFLQCEAWREDKNISYGDFLLSGEMNGEWLKGRKRISTDVSITTASPILEAYYKDSWGLYFGKDVSYGLNIFIWYEKTQKP
ncbi:MAG: hypothetical protein EOO10_04135 [Chitinophagaceae bacterium]|nr:MAG: hypothetical protein EOO10_04135 [Chitinophagaceae bacterium]